MDKQFHNFVDILNDDHICGPRDFNSPLATNKANLFDFEQDCVLTVCSRDTKNSLEETLSLKSDMNQLFSESALTESCRSSASQPLVRLQKNLDNNDLTHYSQTPKCKSQVSRLQCQNLKSKSAQKVITVPVRLIDGVTKLEEQPAKNESVSTDLMSHLTYEEVATDYLKNKRLTSKQKLMQFWTPQQDKLLMQYVEEHGQDWKKIAKIFNDKLITPLRAKKRYQIKVDKKIWRSRFTPEEDETIIEVYRQFGAKWQMVKDLLPHRTENMIKNRFYGHIKKQYFPKGSKSRKAGNVQNLTILNLDRGNSHSDLFSNPKLKALQELTQQQDTRGYLFDDPMSSQTQDPYYNPSEKSNSELFSTVNDQEDNKLSNCLDNLFKEISTDLQIEQKQPTKNQRSYIDDEESIRTEELKKQALDFLRDQKAVEDSEKIIKLQLLAKQMEMIEHLLKNTKNQIHHLGERRRLKRMQQRLQQH